MVKIKKIISIILAAILSLNVFAFADEEKNEHPRQYELLKVLNIIEEKFDLSTGITRGEFADYILKIYGTEPILTESDFTDIKNHDFHDSICTITQLKLMGGYSKESFKPDDTVTYEDAVTVIVRLLGYDVHAVNKGGYPYGYLNVGLTTGITKGLKLSKGNQIIGNDLVQLLYNALTTEILTNNVISDEPEYKEGDNLLSSVFNIYKNKGVVLENEFTRIRDTSTSVNEGNVRIDDQSYRCGETNISDYLGYKINFYYRYDKNLDTKTVIYFYPDENSKIIEIAAENISSVSNNQLLYYKNKDFNREISLKFDGNLDVIFNKKAFSDYTLEDLKPKIGKIIFVSNDSDADFEVALVTSYEDYLVESVKKDGKEIRLKNTNTVFKLDPIGKEVLYSIIKDETKVEIEELKEWDVLTVAKSKDDSIFEIFANNATINGEIISVLQEENETVIKIGEDIYNLSNKCDYVPKVGDMGTFYLDVFGKIVAKSEKGATDNQYGYIISLGKTRDFDPIIKMKVLTTEGIKLYEFATKVALNEKPQRPALDVFNDPDLYVNGVKNGSVSTEQQLVIFKLNNKNNVTNIKTYKNLSTTPHRPSGEEGSFTYDYKMPTDGLYYRSGGGRIFGAKNRVDAKTVIFKVPEGYNKEDQAFAAYNISFLSNDRLYKNMEFYDISKENTIGSIVTRSGGGTATNIIYYDPVFIVDHVNESVYDGSSTYSLYGYYNGEMTSYTALSSDIEDKDEEWGNGVKLSELKKGDVVQISLNTDKKIDEMRVVFRNIDNKQMFENVSGSNAGINYIHGGIHTGYAKVIEKTSKAIVFNSRLNEDIEWDRTYGITTTQNYYKLDSKKNKLTKITHDEIEKGQMIFVQGSYSLLQNVIVYE